MAQQQHRSHLYKYNPFMPHPYLLSFCITVRPWGTTKVCKFKKKKKKSQRNFSVVSFEFLCLGFEGDAIWRHLNMVSGSSWSLCQIKYIIMCFQTLRAVLPFPELHSKYWALTRSNPLNAIGIKRWLIWLIEGNVLFLFSRLTHLQSTLYQSISQRKAQTWMKLLPWWQDKHGFIQSTHIQVHHSARAREREH